MDQAPVAWQSAQLGLLATYRLRSREPYGSTDQRRSGTLSSGQRAGCATGTCWCGAVIGKAGLMGLRDKWVAAREQERQQREAHQASMRRFAKALEL